MQDTQSKGMQRAVMTLAGLSALLAWVKIYLSYGLLQSLTATAWGSFGLLLLNAWFTRVSFTSVSFNLPYATAGALGAFVSALLI